MSCSKIKDTACNGSGHCPGCENYVVLGAGKKLMHTPTTREGGNFWIQDIDPPEPLTLRDVVRAVFWLLACVALVSGVLWPFLSSWF